MRKFSDILGNPSYIVGSTSFWLDIQKKSIFQVKNPVAYPGILFGEGGSTNSVEDRGQRERGSGGSSPLVRGSKTAGSNPAKAIRFFGLKNPQHAFLRRGSKAGCPMSQICGLLKNPVIYVEVGITGQIDRPFLTHNSVLH
jgi:hypothetical protein